MAPAGTFSKTSPQLYQMAEPISLAASIITVAALAATSAKVGQSLIRTAREFKTIGEEIAFVSSQLYSSGTTLDIALKTIQKTEFSEDQSNVCGYLKREKTLITLSQLAKHLRQRIRGIPKAVFRLNSSITFWQAFKWSYTKSKIMEVVGDIQQVQTTVNMIINTISLELNQRHSTTQDPSFRARLIEEK